MECHSHFLSSVAIHVGWYIYKEPETCDIGKAMTRYPESAKLIICYVNRFLPPREVAGKVSSSV